MTGKVAREVPVVLFLCTHNSARSQLAEGLLRHDFGERFEALSAGTEATRVKPLAAAVLEELGIDTSTQTSKTIAELVAQRGGGEPIADIVVTVCDDAREACPYLPARVRNLHHAFRDPSNAEGDERARRQAFVAARDEIRAWLRQQVDVWESEWRRGRNDA